MVQEYGYCTHCNRVTRCKTSASIEGSGGLCVSCGFTWFVAAGERNSYEYITCLNIDLMPERAQAIVDSFHSRKYQKERFRERLEEYIAKSKRERAKIGNSIRRLAKLRTR